MPPHNMHLSNYPNPFLISNSNRNSGTTISFELPKESNVEISIFNIKGQLVTNLKKGIMEKGKHNIVWNGKNETGNNVTSGVFFYKIETKNQTAVKKMLIIK